MLNNLLPLFIKHIIISYNCVNRVKLYFKKIDEITYR